MACAATFLHDLVGQALECAVDFRRGHQLTFFDESHSCVILAQMTPTIGVTPGTKWRVALRAPPGGMVDFCWHRKGVHENALAGGCPHSKALFGRGICDDAVHCNGFWGPSAQKVRRREYGPPRTPETRGDDCRGSDARRLCG